MAQTFPPVSNVLTVEYSRNPETSPIFESPTKVSSFNQLVASRNKSSVNWVHGVSSFPSHQINQIGLIPQNHEQYMGLRINKLQNSSATQKFYGIQSQPQLPYQELIEKEGVGNNQSDKTKTNRDRMVGRDEKENLGKNLNLVEFQKKGINLQDFKDKLLEMEIEYDKKKFRLQSKISKLQSQNQYLTQSNQSLSQQLAKQNELVSSLSQQNLELDILTQRINLQLDDHREKRVQFEKENIQLKMIKKTSFEDLLKEQYEQTNEIKAILEEKNTKIIELINQIKLLERKVSEFEQQKQIESIRCKTKVKNMEQEHQMAMLNKENKIKQQDFNLKNITKKVERIIRENKEKDEFISNYLTKRVSNEEEVQTILKKYICQFSSQELVRAICMGINQVV